MAGEQRETIKAHGIARRIVLIFRTIFAGMAKGDGGKLLTDHSLISPDGGKEIGGDHNSSGGV